MNRNTNSNTKDKNNLAEVAQLALQTSAESSRTLHNTTLHCTLLQCFNKIWKVQMNS